MKLTRLAAIFPCLPKAKAKKKVGWICKTNARVLNNNKFIGLGADMIWWDEDDQQVKTKTIPLEDILIDYND